MFNRFAALGLIALGVLGIILSLQTWQPCYASATSEQCFVAMDAQAHWGTSFALWWAGIAVAVVGVFSRLGRWASIAAIVLLLVAANPAFDPGIGVWDTADTVPGSGVIAASWLIVAGLLVGVGGFIDQYRSNRSIGREVQLAH